MRKNVTQINHLLPEHMRLSPKYKRGSALRLDRRKPVPTLVPGTTNFFIHPTQHRQITEREAAIITGFPKKWTFQGNCKQRCMQIGNAVPVPLATALAKKIRDYIKENENRKKKKETSQTNY